MLAIHYVVAVPKVTFGNENMYYSALKCYWLLNVS